MMMPRILWWVLFCALLVGTFAHKDHHDDHNHRHHNHDHDHEGHGSETHDHKAEESEADSENSHKTYDDEVEPYVEEETTTLEPGATTVVDFEPWLEEQIETQFRKSLPVFARFNGDPNVTIDCSAALIKFMLSLKKLQPWALRMMDAMGKPSSGLASGSIADHGNYDQCLAVEAPDGDEDVDFTGQYCSLYLNPKNVPFLKKIIARFQENGEYVGRSNPLKWLNQDLFLGIRMGICIPSKCGGDEIQYMTTTLLGKYGVTPTVSGCELPRTGNEPLTRTQKFMFGLIASFTFVIIVASLAEYFLIWKNNRRDRPVSKAYALLHCFSAVENTRKLLSTKAAIDSDAYRFRFIHGLRFFSASWVILGHTYFLVIPTSLAESLNIIKLQIAKALYPQWKINTSDWSQIPVGLANFPLGGHSLEIRFRNQEDIWFCLIGNAFPCIQTFLFMSGFLLTYNILKYLPSYKKSLALPIFLLLARRYIRLTAPIMFLVGLFLVLPRFISGPVYSEYKGIIFGQCETNWWRILLHINNWVPFFDMCLAHLWYISVDWQIYATLWVIPIIMLRRKRLGLGLCFFVIITTAILVGVQTKANGYQPTPIYSDSEINRTFDASNEVYFKPFAHAGSFCVGIITGYLVLIYGACKLTIATQGALWAASSTICLLVVFGPHKWFAGAPHEGWDAIIYAATHRTAWSVGLAWLTFACATGRGGLINGLLSWKALIPMSRLSFSAFMLQTVVLIARTMVARDRLVYSHEFMIKDFFATYMITYLCSFVLYILVEAPIGNLEKLIFMGSAPKKVTESTNPTRPTPTQHIEHVVTMESIQKKHTPSYGDLKTVRL